MTRNTKTLIGFLGLACLMVAGLTGCGRGRAATVMRGSVKCGGEDVPGGTITFVPLESSVGRIATARIVDGRYRIQAGGGVAVGKYRVQIDAWRKTGRKVVGNNGVEQAMIDEKVNIGPAAYSGDKSPLTVEVRGDSDGVFDVAMPSQ